MMKLHRGAHRAVLGLTLASAMLGFRGVPVAAAARSPGPARGSESCPVSPAHLSATVASTPQNSAAILAGQIGQEVSRQPANVSADDLEAAIVFSVSQSGVGSLLSLAALNRLNGCDYGHRNFQTALSRVRSTLTQHRFAVGTSALAGASGSNFSDFAINLGGGTSNYSR